MAVNLLKFRQTVRTERIYLPDGSWRHVKVTTNDAGSTQHVEDGEHVHGTGKPPAVRVAFRKPGRNGLLRNLGMPKIRQAFQRSDDGGLWAPVPGSEELL